MSNLNKQDVEKCVKNVLQQKRIPGEEGIRKIVKEEVEAYFQREEQKQKEAFSKKFVKYFREKKWMSIGWYILMFVLLFFVAVGFAILTGASKQLITNYKNLVDIGAVIIVITSLFLECFAILLTMMIYDKLLEKDHKHAKLVCLLEIIYWCKVLLPEQVTLFEYIL